jgi:RNA polymerase sigma-70 factor (family 1)
MEELLVDIPISKKPEVLTPDQDTIQKFIEGDEKAFVIIFNQYYQSIYRLVIRFVKSPDLTADIVQDVFIKLWENRGAVNLTSSFKSYVFTIAKNHVLNILKRASKEEMIKKEIISHTLMFNTSNEDSIVYGDLASVADKAIESLPPQRKIVFKMHKDEGKDQHEIAAALGISRNTVRDHLAKADKFLRVSLKIHTEFTSLLIVALLLLW